MINSQIDFSQPPWSREFKFCIAFSVFVHFLRTTCILNSSVRDIVKDSQVEILWNFETGIKSLNGLASL